MSSTELGSHHALVCELGKRDMFFQDFRVYGNVFSNSVRSVNLHFAKSLLPETNLLVAHLKPYSELTIIMLSKMVMRLAVTDAHATAAVRSAGLHSLVIEYRSLAKYILNRLAQLFVGKKAKKYQ
jgi:hypothetical protein